VTVTRVPPQPIPAPEQCFHNVLSLDFGFPNHKPHWTAAYPQPEMATEEGLWEWGTESALPETAGALYRGDELAGGDLE